MCRFAEREHGNDRTVQSPPNTGPEQPFPVPNWVLWLAGLVLVALAIALLIAGIAHGSVIGALAVFLIFAAGGAYFISAAARPAPPAPPPRA